MKIQIRIDPSISEKEITITSPAEDEELQRIYTLLSQAPAPLPLWDASGALHLLYPEEIAHIYALKKKVYARTLANELYTLRLRLYEVENAVPESFVRISYAEIINLKCVQHFDFTYANTIVIRLLDGNVCYVSRRYLPRIKKQLEGMKKI